MSYENKYKESKKSADLLYEKGYYDSAVNRYYYCIYQMLLEYNKRNDIVIEKEKLNGKDSHKITIKLFCQELREERNFNYKSKRELENILFYMKRIRAKSDYEEEEAKKDEVDILRREVKSFFQVYYGDNQEGLL